MTADTPQATRDGELALRLAKADWEIARERNGGGSWQTLDPVIQQMLREHARAFIVAARHVGLLVDPDDIDDQDEQWAYRDHTGAYLPCLSNIATHRRTVTCYRTVVYGPWQEVPTDG